MSKQLVQRVKLLGPSGRGGGSIAFEAPAYLVRSGLALHPAWGFLGPVLDGRMFVISAVPMGWRVGAFHHLADAEAAFVALEALPVKWHRLGPKSTARYPADVQRAVVKVLEKHGADFLRREPKKRSAHAR